VREFRLSRGPYPRGLRIGGRAGGGESTQTPEFPVAWPTQRGGRPGRILVPLDRRDLHGLARGWPRTHTGPSTFADAQNRIGVRATLRTHEPEGGFEPVHHVLDIPNRAHRDLGVEVGVEVGSEMGVYLPTLAQESAILVGIRPVTHHVGIARVVVARPARP